MTRDAKRESSLDPFTIGPNGVTNFTNCGHHALHVLPLRRLQAPKPAGEFPLNCTIEHRDFWVKKKHLEPQMSARRGGARKSHLYHVVLLLTTARDDPPTLQISHVGGSRAMSLWFKLWGVL